MQHDYVIANQGFPAFRSDLNDALAAIVSNNSGATEPTTMFAHQMWVDTAANPSVLKIRNADNDAWITIGTINQTGDTFTLTSAVSATTLNTSGAVVFNDAGADVDFRVEGDTDANLLFVDASADAVGIGTNAPSTPLEVNGGTLNRIASFVSTDGTSLIEFADDSTTNRPAVGAVADDLVFQTNGEKARITSAGEVGIGTDAPAAKMHIFGLNQNFLTSRNSVPAGATSGLGGYQFGGYSTGTTTVATASIAGLAGGAWDASSTPSQMLFFTTPSGTTTPSERLRIDSSGDVGIGTSSPGTKLDVQSAGTVDTEVEYSRFYGGGTSQPCLRMGGNNTTTAGDRYVFLNAESLSGSGQKLILQSDGNDVIIVGTNGSVTMPYVYSDTVTGRDLYISSAGVLGYVSSVRASKTNIEDLPSIDWLYQLNPVKFQYRTKDEEENYTDTADAEIQYGLIAEDVAEVNPDLVFGDETENGFELRGVQYSRLIAPMLKAIQELKAELDAAKERIAALENA